MPSFDFIIISFVIIISCDILNSSKIVPIPISMSFKSKRALDVFLMLIHRCRCMFAIREGVIFKGIPGQRSEATEWGEGVEGRRRGGHPPTAKTARKKKQYVKLEL